MGFRGGGLKSQVNTLPSIALVIQLFLSLRGHTLINYVVHFFNPPPPPSITHRNTFCDPLDPLMLHNAKNALIL